MQNDIEQLIAQQIELGVLKSFPKSTAVRDEFVRAAGRLCQQIEQHGVSLERRHVEGLVVKLGKYCARRQWNVAAVEGELSTLADAISAKPDGLTNPTLTLTKMIELHSAWNQQAAAAMRRELLANPSADAPPAVIAHSADGAYRLVECLTQMHLQEETRLGPVREQPTRSGGL
jgi:hypothetical protein